MASFYKFSPIFLLLVGAKKIYTEKTPLKLTEKTNTEKLDAQTFASVIWSYPTKNYFWHISYLMIRRLFFFLATTLVTEHLQSSLGYQIMDYEKKKVVSNFE